MTIFQPAPQEVNTRECNAVSRRTWAGSSESEHRCQSNSQYNTSSLNSKLPEYDYPVQVLVRNTFIETRVVRPLSLDEFYEERRIHSVPPEFGNQHDGVKSSEPQPLHHALATGVQTFVTKVATAAGFCATPEDKSPTPFPESYYLQQHGGLCATPEDGSPTPFMGGWNFFQQVPRVLMLSEALPESAALGSPELPTVGSAGHYAGACKPCAFFYVRGCENGPQCSFCHLCAPDEKRKRQKEKQAVFRERRRQRNQVRF